MPRNLPPGPAANEIRTFLTAAVARVVKELPLAMMETEAEFKQRVFKNGLSTNAGPIGSYSTRPGYFSVEGLRSRYGSQIPTSKLKPRGKPRYGRKKGFTDRRYRGERVELKSVYFADGYSGLRRALGRQVNTVDLKLSGALERSIKTGFRGNEAEIAFTNEERQKIAAGHEERYGKQIFALGIGEEGFLLNRLGEAADDALVEHQK